ncbi:MAG: hypothetical protein RMJ37_01480 [Spirochaetia bacterium]|nr:hypothetical protein [Spirochaetota bacterium]MCX8097367.1 hypothetical protein [Spirochaetota bacterium]MDW8111994.1 hypothetical protein [Spirochaetia bacterium]
MDVNIIDNKVLELLKQNKGIIAFGYIGKGDYPIAEPKFVVDIDLSSNTLSFFESKQEVADYMKNSKSVSVSLFDWSGKVFDGYQLKGIVEVFPKGSKVFNEILERYNSRSLKPEFLNEFLALMEESKIIPTKNFIIQIKFNIKYSQAPSPESAKPIVVLR